MGVIKSGTWLKDIATARTNLLARWPVTASLLRKVAESYDSYAGWHDERAEWFDLAGF